MGWLQGAAGRRESEFGVCYRNLEFRIIPVRLCVTSGSAFSGCHVALVACERKDTPPERDELSPRRRGCAEDPGRR
jgi:hypothetical protein